MKKLLFISMIISITFVSLAAQPKGPGERDRRNLDAMRIWKLTEVLELTDEQVETFLPKLQLHEREIKAVHAEITALQKELIKLSESEDMNQKKAQKLIDKYLDKQAEIHQLKADFIRASSDYLTPKQQLLFISFETRFRRDLKDYMMERRGGRHRPGRP